MAHKSNSQVSQMVTTVSQHRIGLFQPVKQLQKTGRDIVVENKHGTCVLKNCRLTQIHAGIMEALFASARRADIKEDGQIWLQVSLPDVLRAMDMSTRNHTWLQERLEDMRIQRVQATFKEHVIASPGSEGMIRKVFIDGKESIPAKGSATPGALYWVCFESSFSKFYLHDLRVDWRIHLPTLRKMSGPAQALARYCLTHSEVNGPSIVSILERLGQKWEGKNRATRMAETVKTVTDDSELFERLGIEIECGPKVADKKIWYSKAATELKTGRVDVRMLPIASQKLQCKNGRPE